LEHGRRKPADVLEGTSQLPTGAWRVTVATRKVAVAREDIPSAARVAVRWEEKKRACVESIADGKGEIWNCGSIATPPRFSTAIERRTILLAAVPGDRDAEELAVDLLDSGSADIVILKPDGQPSSTGLDFLSLEGHEVLAIPRSPWGSLARRLRFEG